MSVLVKICDHPGIVQLLIALEHLNEYGLFYGRPTPDITAGGHRHSYLAAIVELHYSLLPYSVRSGRAFANDTDMSWPGIPAASADSN